MKGTRAIAKQIKGWCRFNWRIKILQQMQTRLKQRRTLPILQWRELTGHSLFLSLEIQKNKLFGLEFQAATKEVVQVNAENRVAVEVTVTASKYVVFNEEQVHRELLAAQIQYTLKSRVLAQEVAAMATE